MPINGKRRDGDGQGSGGLTDRCWRVGLLL